MARRAAILTLLLAALAAAQAPAASLSDGSSAPAQASAVADAAPAALPDSSRPASVQDAAAAAAPDSSARAAAPDSARTAPAPDTALVPVAAVPGDSLSPAAPGSASAPADTADSAETQRELSRLAQSAAKSSSADTLYRLDFQVAVGALFLDFGVRDRLNSQLSAFLAEEKKAAATRADSAALSVVRFQNVDLTVPVNLGVRWSPHPAFSLAAGGQWTDHSQDALLLKREGYSSYRYNVQIWAAYAEAAVAIPLDFVQLDNGNALRVALRRYWLPASFLSTEWQGKTRRLWADADPLGAGWGLLLGSEFGRTGPLRMEFNLQWRSIRAETPQRWAVLLPDADKTSRAKAAKWDLGGFGIECVFSWGTFAKIAEKGEKSAKTTENATAREGADF